MRMLAWCGTSALVLLLIGCTGSSTAPSSTTASISGTVRASSNALSVNGSASAAMTVMVAGTSISSTVVPGGRFALADVPAGNTTLLFSGDGVNAKLPLGMVRGGERITIGVSVNGSNATLESREDDNENDNDDESDDHEVEGRIAGLGGGCPNLTFTIGTTSVKTSNSTQFKGVACTALANGTKVEVTGARVNGVLQATKIERDD